MVKKITYNFIVGENMTNNKVPNIPMDLTEQLRSNRAVVVMDIVESERAHVTELKTLIQSFLMPLKNSNMYQIFIMPKMFYKYFLLKFYNYFFFHIYLYIE